MEYGSSELRPNINKVLPGVLCAYEYKYVMGDDGVIKKVQAQSNSGDESPKHPLWIWITLIMFAVGICGFIVKNNEVQQVEYQLYRGDFTWYQADAIAKENGGRLATINSRSEFDKLCEIADDNDVKVLWVGAMRTSDSWETTGWNNGNIITFAQWYPGEPSYYNSSGIAEEFLMLFKVDGNWYFNDAENDVTKYYSGKIGFIVEYNR